LLKNYFRLRYFTQAAKAAIEKYGGYHSAEAVLFHDILYSCYQDILYTAARAERVR
jgi:hypothetical protein